MADPACLLTCRHYLLTTNMLVCRLFLNEIRFPIRGTFSGKDSGVRKEDFAPRDFESFDEGVLLWYACRICLFNPWQINLNQLIGMAISMQQFPEKFARLDPVT